ncbi:hypothetical protein BC830DRAFT_1162722 [Chytriomyces sp. MP71]|nr:hypothetical protein BC830DRAFT_1162722 [Chytriomyces sp. MP71]
MHETASPWYKFKLFVLQTKVLESGVGVVLGKAFQEFVRSFLNDLLAPPFLYIFQNKATQRFLVIKQGRTPKRRYRTVEEAVFDGALTINYGKFGHSCVNFFVVGLSVYYFLNGERQFMVSETLVHMSLWELRKDLVELLFIWYGMTKRNVAARRADSEHSSMGDVDRYIAALTKSTMMRVTRAGGQDDIIEVFRINLTHHSLLSQPNQS